MCLHARSSAKRRWNSDVWYTQMSSAGIIQMYGTRKWVQWQNLFACTIHLNYSRMLCGVLQCIAVCCSMLQCVAVCCSVLQCVAVCCRVLQCISWFLHKSRHTFCHIHTHKCTHAHIYICIYVCIHICTFKHTPTPHTHTYTHPHTNLHTHTSFQPPTANRKLAHSVAAQAASCSRTWVCDIWRIKFVTYKWVNSWHTDDSSSTGSLMFTHLSSWRVQYRVRDI